MIQTEKIVSAKFDYYFGQLVNLQLLVAHIDLKGPVPRPKPKPIVKKPHNTIKTKTKHDQKPEKSSFSGKNKNIKLKSQPLRSMQ